MLFSVVKETLVINLYKIHPVIPMLKKLCGLMGFDIFCLLTNSTPKLINAKKKKNIASNVIP